MRKFELHKYKNVHYMLSHHMINIMNSLHCLSNSFLTDLYTYHEEQSRNVQIVDLDCVYA